ncbi:MAG: 30S ribosomal protein S1 [Thermodesulfobacteriota bacterium]|nr:MAG: 30S ribosomal protein S1 [Thermodesulfobacteriota bacterium]
MVEEKNFADLVDESMNAPEVGKLFTGLVVRVDKDDVFIDFGSKSEGVAPTEEFLGKSGELAVKVGDEVEVMLERYDHGLPRLSRRKAGLLIENKVIQEKYDSGELIEAIILQKVKGGFIADIGEKSEIRAFLPASQLDIRPQSNPDSAVGNKLEVRIIKFTNRDIVVSRRAFLEEQRETLKKETLSKLEEGMEIQGKVVNIINQGVFVDLGGLEGFIPISELSWGRINHPSDVISADQEINTKILTIQGEEKVTLSLKAVTPDPWDSVSQKYQPGSVVKGKAASLMDFGVFVQLEPGIEGLVHVSEITWTKRFRHPKEIIEAGSIVEAMVLEVSQENRRISLSLKQIEPSPWQLFKNENPPKSVLKGTIRNVTDRGIFVEVAENIVGLVRPDNISWTGRVNPEESYKKGDEIDVVVLNVDEKNERVGLGVKQLSGDPWEDAQQKYKQGKSAVTGKVKEVKDRGVVIELDDNIEGYIRANELGQDKDDSDALKKLSPGDEITAQVVGFDRRNRQVNLSVKRHTQKVEKERVSDFNSSQAEPNATLGDLLGKQLKTINDDEVA